jgi:hypothetical protein
MTMIRSLHSERDAFVLVAEVAGTDLGSTLSLYAVVPGQGARQTARPDAPSGA